MYRNLEYSHLLFFFLYIVILVRIIGVCLALFNQVTRHISLSLSLCGLTEWRKIEKKSERRIVIRVHSISFDRNNLHFTLLITNKKAMSSIIHAVGHALTGHGHGDISEKRSSVHTVVCEDVQVKSTVNSESQSKVSSAHSSQSKIHSLMSKLGSTHAQIDAYSRRRNEEISEAVQASIEKIVHETHVHQQQLLEDAQQQSNIIESEYKEKLVA